MNRKRVVFGGRSPGGWAGLIGTLLSVAVVAGCSSVPGNPVAVSNEGLFYAAVLDLMTQPVAHVVSPDSDGKEWDLRITSDGWSTGTVGTGDQRTELLQTGTSRYAKPPRTVLASNLPRGKSAADLEGRWLTGSESFFEGVPGRLEPDELAEELLTALGEAEEFPRAGDRTIQIGADLAYEVVTPKGTLAVSANQPYRVLRFIPAADSPSATLTPDATVPSDNESGGVAPRFDPLAVPLNFVLMTPAAREQTYNDIAAQLQGLSNVADLGVQFDYNSSAEMKCANDSCVVTATVRTSTTAAAGTRLTGGVDTVMKASITVDGTPSAGCVAAQKIAINGSATMTCTDVSVAALVAAIGARKQAEADAQARAQGRSVTVEYVINYKGSVDFQVAPMIQADIDRVVKQVRGDQDKARSGTSCGPNCSYQLVPYGGDSLSQAAGRERQVAGTAPNNNILVALVPGWNDPETGDLVVGSGASENSSATAGAESDVRDQLTARGYNPSQITAMYSERQPCFATCGSKLQGVKPDTPVSYSVPWKDNGPSTSSAADKAVVALSSGAGAQ
ncbi:nucleic acid/nucleotide deaminase domain-containing protein [Nocardia sp. NPDC055321]